MNTGCKDCLNKGKYGHLNNKLDLYCKKHNSTQMVRIKNIICINGKCINLAKFNYINYKPLYCENHRLPNMVKTLSQYCNIIGCGMFAKYNYIGEKLGMYCKNHKRENMFNLATFKNCKYCTFNSKSYHICDECVMYPIDPRYLSILRLTSYSSELYPILIDKYVKNTRYIHYEFFTRSVVVVLNEDIKEDEKENGDVLKEIRDLYPDNHNITYIFINYTNFINNALYFMAALKNEIKDDEQLNFNKQNKIYNF